MAGDTSQDYSAHIHAELNIWVNGVFQPLPANVGVTADNVMSYIHTHEAGNLLHRDPINGVPPTTPPKLGDFFDAWRTNAGLAGNRADAIFNSNQIFGNVVDGTHSLKMFVNGVENDEFQNYVFEDGDDIAIVYTDNPLVTLKTNLGSITLELLTDDAPDTVDNFLNYVNSGRYNNTIFHRLAKGFVAQAGGFTSSSPTFTNRNQFTSVVTDPPIDNEYKLSNVRGTVAMAKLGGDPDSATSQFFINLADNSSNLNNQNGGFTVFANVVDMHVADVIGALNTSNQTSPFNELPLTADNKVVRVESIEGEGLLSGRIFEDINGDFFFGPGEFAMKDIVVYTDLDGDGVRDANEAFTTTDDDGFYNLRLPGGSYLIRQDLPAAYRQTAPLNINDQQVTVPIGRQAQLIFANQQNTSNNGDTYTVAEDSPATQLSVLDNDKINGSSANLSIASVGTPTKGGTVTVSADNKKINYTPAANFAGGETFTYTLTNGTQTETVTVVVNVTNVNDSPLAVDDTVTVNESDPSTTLQVLSNDSSAPDTGETLIITAVSATTAGGQITVAADGKSISYKPAAGFIGTDTFTYTISDRATGGLTDQATVTVNVAEINDPPKANADTFIVAEDTANTELDLLANDSILPDTGETLTLVSVSGLNRGGSATLVSGTGKVKYTPAANFNGTETFQYVLRDSRGAQATGQVSVTVTPVNDLPVALNDTYSFTKNSAAQLLNVLANDTDPLDGTSSLKVINVGTGSQGGVLQLVDNGQRISYTPAPNAVGTETFSYTVQDADGAQSTATVSIDIRNFVPSNLSGYVYFDVNNNGAKDASELPIGGVTVTLTGTDNFGAAVNLTQVTTATGAYSFQNLAPGQYKLTQQQPALLIDGRATAGVPGAATGNNQMTFNLQENTNAVNNNFGELGRQSSTVSILDALSSSKRSRTLAAVNAQNVTQWYTYSGPASNSLTPTGVRVNNTAKQVEILAQKTGNQTVAATVPTSSTGQVMKLGSPTSTQLYQVQGELDRLNFQPTTTSSSGQGTLSSAIPAPLSVTGTSTAAAAVENTQAPASSSASTTSAAATAGQSTGSVSTTSELADVAAATAAVPKSTSVNPLLAALASSQSTKKSTIGSAAAVDAALSDF